MGVLSDGFYGMFSLTDGTCLVVDATYCGITAVCNENSNTETHTSVADTVFSCVDGVVTATITTFGGTDTRTVYGIECGENCF